MDGFEVARSPVVVDVVLDLPVVEQLRVMP
jgi:hypothetical protein